MSEPKRVAVAVAALLDARDQAKSSAAYERNRAERARGDASVFVANPGAYADRAELLAKHHEGKAEALDRAIAALEEHAALVAAVRAAERVMEPPPPCPDENPVLARALAELDEALASDLVQRALKR